MARKLCLEFAGAIYHVLNRGERRKDIFEDDRDRERILTMLAEQIPADRRGRELLANGGRVRALNPVGARLLRAEERLWHSRWSGFRECPKPPAQRSTWLWMDRLLGECGIPSDSAAGRRA